MTAELQRSELSPPKRRYRFSLGTLLAFVALLAAIGGLAVERQRHAETRTALSRYEAEQISTRIPSGKFRVIARTIVDKDHVKVARYRIESREKFFGELIGRDGGGSGLASRYDADAGIHHAEWTYVFDHLPKENKLKVSGMGYAVFTVPKDYSLDSGLELNNVDGTYELDAAVKFFVLNGNPYSLSLR